MPPSRWVACTHIASCSQQFVYLFSLSTSQITACQATMLVSPPNRPTSLGVSILLFPRDSRLQAFRARHLVSRCSTSLLPFNRVPYRAVAPVSTNPQRRSGIDACCKLSPVQIRSPFTIPSRVSLPFGSPFLLPSHDPPTFADRAIFNNNAVNRQTAAKPLALTSNLTTSLAYQSYRGTL